MRHQIANTGAPALQPYYKNLIQLNFLKFLESLTGIEGLISDPYYVGGGIHETKKGGFLKVHTDFNYHKKLKLDRRVNLLLYLNSDWKEEYGGHLELWDKDMLSCKRKVLPVINRMAIFSTTDFSYHGHPEPLSCPDNRSRRSLALYYYTNGRPASELEFDKSTVTNYQERPGEVFNKAKKPLGRKLRKKNHPTFYKIGIQRAVFQGLLKFVSRFTQVYAFGDNRIVFDISKPLKL